MSGSSSPASLSPRVEPAERHCGVAWTAAGPVTAAELEPLRDLGVTWITQTPFGWQRSIEEPEIHLTPDRGFWGERDEGLVTTLRIAHELGIKSLLKPHIWLVEEGHAQYSGSQGGQQPTRWLGAIRFRNEEEWERWFASYRHFLLHYAELAERASFDGLVVGAELEGTLERQADWRRLIAEVRSVYGGPLTYAASWRRFEQVPFWDALDAIGVQAYFPLSSDTSPALGALLEAWREPKNRLAALAQVTGKPVLFTEIGYRSMADAGVRPWEWTERISTEAAPDLELQTRLYEAFFRSLWDEPWFAGAYFWKWYPHGSHGRVHDLDFSPQGKPAEAVLARWYGATHVEAEPSM
ncbi:MAG: glycoside hydrolase family 113 [Thermoanaerobaculia bacterium]